MSGFPYKKILIVGATSGIGWALAERFVENGHKVVVVGRRQDKLDEFVSKYGKDKADSFAFDITKLSDIPSFASKITAAHPDLDSVFLNSGIQRGHNFAEPTTVDAAVIDEEMTTNYIAPIRLTLAFLPHLQSYNGPTSLIYTTSGLALSPITRCANYCASKAALHHWILVLREQLKVNKNLKVIEIFPPAVQTELHDAKHQPDIKDGHKIGMPLTEFTDEAWKGLDAGKEQVPVGMSVGLFEKFENSRQEVFAHMVEAMGKGP